MSFLGQQFFKIQIARLFFDLSVNYKKTLACGKFEEEEEETKSGKSAKLRRKKEALNHLPWVGRLAAAIKPLRRPVLRDSRS